jgi:hypothetical protein
VYALIEVQVRLARPEDRKCLARLLEINGVSRGALETMRFLVAGCEKGIGAAITYRVERESLCLGPLVSDPLAEERPPARLLYAEAVVLARHAGLREVRSELVYGDYQYEVGYRRGWRVWRADPTRRLRLRSRLSDTGWRRMLAIWEVVDLNLFPGRRKRPDAVAGRKSGRQRAER